MVRSSTTNASNPSRKNAESSNDSTESMEDESMHSESEPDELESDELGSEEEQYDDGQQQKQQPQQQRSEHYSSSDGERMLLSFSQIRDDEASEAGLSRGSGRPWGSAGTVTQAHGAASRRSSARTSNVIQAKSQPGSSGTGSGDSNESESIFYGSSSAPESLAAPRKRKRTGGSTVSRSSSDSSDHEAVAQHHVKRAAVAKPSPKKRTARHLLPSKRWMGEPTSFQVQRYSSILDEHVADTERLLHPQVVYDWASNGVPPSPPASSTGPPEVSSTSAAHDRERTSVASSSSWTEVEQDLFFSALARHSRWRPDLIASEINLGIAAFHSTSSHLSAPLPSARADTPAWPKGKTTAQVTLYLERLQYAAEIPRVRASVERGIELYPAATEMSDAYVRWEEKTAAKLFDAEEAMEARGAYRQRLKAQERERLDGEQEDEEMGISDSDEDGEEALDHAHVSLLASLQRRDPNLYMLGLHGGSSQIELQGYIRTGQEVCAMFREPERRRTWRSGSDFGRSTWLRFKAKRKGMAFPRTDTTVYVRALVVQLIEKGRILAVEGDDEDDDEDEEGDEAPLHLHNGNGKLSDDEKRKAVMQDKPSYLAGRKLFIPATRDDLDLGQSRNSKALTTNKRRQKEAFFLESLAQTAEAVRRAQNRAEVALMANVQASASLKELKVLFPVFIPKPVKPEQSHAQTGMEESEEEEEETSAGSDIDDIDEWALESQKKAERKRSELRRLREAGKAGTSAQLEAFLKLLDVRALTAILDSAGSPPATQRCFAAQTLLDIYKGLVTFLREVCTEAILTADPNMAPIDERITRDIIRRVAPHLQVNKTSSAPADDDEDIEDVTAIDLFHPHTWTQASALGRRKSRTASRLGARVKLPDGIEGDSRARVERNGVMGSPDHDSLGEEEEEQQREEQYLSDASSVYEDRVAEVWQGSIQAFLKPASRAARRGVSRKAGGYALIPSETPVPFGEQTQPMETLPYFATYMHRHHLGRQGEETGVPGITPSATDLEDWELHGKLERHDKIRDRTEEKGLLLSMLGLEEGEREEGN